MSSASVNLSNESPASSVTLLPIPPLANDIQDPSTFTLPLSPRMTATVMAVLEMAPDDLQGLVYGLLQTLDKHDKDHAKEVQDLQGQIETAEDSFNEISTRLAEYEQEDKPMHPDDFEPNEGKVTTLIPITDGVTALAPLTIPEQPEAEWFNALADTPVVATPLETLEWLCTPDSPSLGKRTYDLNTSPASPVYGSAEYDMMTGPDGLTAGLMTLSGLNGQDNLEDHEAKKVQI